MIEEWKDFEVENYGVIQVSNLGKVKSKTGKILSERITKDGYVKIRVTWVDSNGKDKEKTFTIHRLVAMCFNPTDDDTLEIDHIDGNKKNNRVDNLEWVTHRENIKRAYEMGKYIGLKGEANGRSKLTKSQVKDIRNLYFNGVYTRAELGRLYNITWSMVNFIVKGLNWK